MPRNESFPNCGFPDQGYDCYARYTTVGYRTKCCHVLNGMPKSDKGCPFHKSKAQFNYEQTIYPYDESKCSKEEEYD